MVHRFGLGVIVIAALVGLGCGGDDEGDDGGSGGSGTPAAGTGGSAAGTGGSAAGTGGGGAGMGGADTCVADFMSQGGQTMECAMCACSMCTTELTNLEGLSAADRALADAVIACSRENCCSGTACYCGAADLAACSMAAAGPCVTEIEAAAGGMGLAAVAGPAGTPTSALGAPSALGRCLNGDMAMMLAAKCASCAPTCN